MTAFLPRQDPDRLLRKAELLTQRFFYRYNHTHVSPLSLVSRVPEHDEFSLRWMAAVAERIMRGFENSIEIEADEDYREFHKQQHRFLGKLLERGENALGDLRRIVGDVFKFRGRLGAPLERASSLDDYSSLFRCIGLPPIHADVMDDGVFADMRVAGPNPFMLRRYEEPDDRFPVTDAHFRAALPDDSLEAAIAEGRTYIADYEMLEDIEPGEYPHGRKYVYAPLALFAVAKQTGRLTPVAIQCKQQPAADNPIFTPQHGWNWTIAKTIVSIADGNVHEAVMHLGRTHLLIEPFVISTHRQLSGRHPLCQLLKPHFEGTLAINDAAWKHLIANKGGVDKLLGGSIEATRGLVVRQLQNYRFDETQPPTTFAARGVADPETLPNFPYRDDGLLYWQSIREWAADYLGLYYTSAHDLAQDVELAAWCQELTSHDGGRVIGLGPNGSIRDAGQLTDLVSSIIFTCSVQHAAVNFPQFDLMSYVPNMPLAGYAPAPTSTQGATEADYLAMLPPLDMAELQLDLGYLLGTVHYTRLGDYPQGHFTDPRVAAPLERFQRRIGEIGEAIAQRNRQRRPYDFLVPAGIPQSINI